MYAWQNGSIRIMPAAELVNCFFISETLKIEKEVISFPKTQLQTSLAKVFQLNTFSLFQDYKQFR